LADLHHALQIDPTDPEFHYAKADTLWSIGLPEQAEESFRKTLELDPQNLECRFDFVEFLFEQERTEEAAALLEETVTMISQRTDVWDDIVRDMEYDPTFKSLIQRLNVATEESDDISHSEYMERIMTELWQYLTGKKK
jgi:tetratricopeptide (TPR) repeat protein